MITLTLRLKNRDPGRDGEVSTQWPRSTVRGCPPPHMHKKTYLSRVGTQATAGRLPAATLTTPLIVRC